MDKTPSKRVGRTSYSEWKQSRTIPSKLNNSVALANRKEIDGIRNSFAQSLSKEKLNYKVTIPSVEKSYMAQTKSKVQRMQQIQDDLNFDLSRQFVGNQNSIYKQLKKLTNIPSEVELQ